ncbi:MAG: cysteine desulfurase/selenocysteine lyase [Oceanospirillaceae bacterium]|jgi:cysteine desulfurase/selenocysteine lyase
MHVGLGNLVDIQIVLEPKLKSKRKLFMPEFNIAKVRRDFPILSLRVNGKPLVYFDNAATTQKPRVVLDTLNQFYKLSNANVHRGSHTLSNTATSTFEKARRCVANYINAPSDKEIIWCKGTTEAINLAANSLGDLLLKQGDTILVSVSEHHANIVPWQLIARSKGAKVVAIPLTTDLRIDQLTYQQLLAKHQPKIVALGHVSNALGTIHPIASMIKKAHAMGAITLIDGAQAIAHLPVDVQQLGCDFYCFSAHKCYGPTGIGVLWGKEELLLRMPPWQGGGEMIESVSFQGTTFNELPFKFEAGTPPISAAIGLMAALEYLQKMDAEQTRVHEQKLLNKMLLGLQQIPAVILHSPTTANIGVVSFSVENVHHQDLAVLLDQDGIAVRSGHHCAMPLMQAIGIEGTLRASISFYNTSEEVDYFIQALIQNIDILNSDNQHHEESIQALQNYTAYPNAEIIIAQLSHAATWQLRFSYLLALGELLEKPSAKFLTDEFKLKQCESGVWLTSLHENEVCDDTINDNHATQYLAWSDAKIMRGLIVMLISCKLPAQLDITAFLEEVKLTRFLSPSRTNGVKAILQAL